MKNTHLLNAIGKPVTLTTISPAILGDSYYDCKLLSVMSFEEAKKYRPILNIHDSLTTLNPQLSKPEEQLYFLFSIGTDFTLLLADEWIKEAAIDGKLKVRFTLTLPYEELTALMLVLNQQGFNPLLESL